jgi:hypothetical protein
LRARPEPTQFEHLSGTSFLGKLLVFLANVRLDWKVIASYTNTLAYFGLPPVTEKKMFENTDTWYMASSHSSLTSLLKNRQTTK